MRTLPFLAAPVAVALSLFGGAARADDAAAPLPQLPPAAAATSPAPAPAAAPAAATTVQTATTADGRVVVVAQGSDPSFQLAGPKKTKRVWYGWQTLVFDGAAIVGGASLAAAGTDFGGWFWIGTYTLAPPAVHIGHGRVGIAFADLGVRVGAPLVTTLIGAAIACHGNSSDGFSDLDQCASGVGIGFLVGYASAIAIDAAVFARETVEVDETEEQAELAREKRKRASTFTILPDVGLGQNRATIGLHGLF